MMICGMMPPEVIWMASTNTMIGLCPRKRYRVRAAHAKNATIIDRTIERCMGQNTGVVVMISSRGFTAVIIIQ